MPTTQSAEKRIRQDTKRARRNRRRKRRMKETIRAVRDAVEAGDTTAAQQLLPAAYKAIDKAAGKGPLHKNAAARYKSRLMHFVHTSKE